MGTRFGDMICTQQFCNPITIPSLTECIASDYAESHKVGT